MTILRPPSRPSSRRRGHWFLWAVGGVVIALVLLMSVVKSLMSNRESAPAANVKADVTRQVIEVGPGLRYEVLVPATDGQGKKEKPSEGGKSTPSKAENSKAENSKAENSKAENSKTEHSKTEHSKAKH